MKKSVSIISSMALALALTTTLAGTTAEPESISDARTQARAKLEVDPDDHDGIYHFTNATLAAAAIESDRSPDSVNRILDDGEAFLGTLKARTNKGREHLKYARERFSKICNQLRETEEDLRKQLTLNPGDKNALSRLTIRTGNAIRTIAEYDPNEARRRISDHRSFLAGLQEAAIDQAAKRRLANSNESLVKIEDWIARIVEPRLEATRKHSALIGTKAAPLNIENWVNSSPLSESDLKGRVVLLDFFGVFCGPCIEQFPLLRELQREHEKTA